MLPEDGHAAPGVLVIKGGVSLLVLGGCVRGGACWVR